MAATKGFAQIERNINGVVSTFQLSALTSDATETVTHSGPSGVAPVWVEFVTITRPTSGDPVFCEWIEANNDTTNNEIDVRFWTVAGGDLTGCVVKVRVTFLALKSGGIG